MIKQSMEIIHITSKDCSKQIKDVLRNNSDTKIPFTHVRHCNHAIELTRSN